MENTSKSNEHKELLPEIPWPEGIKPSETPPPLKTSPAFIEQQRKIMAEKVAANLEIEPLTNEKIEAWLTQNETHLKQGLTEMFKLGKEDTMTDTELDEFINELTPDNLKKSPAVLFAHWFGRLEGQGKQWPIVGEEVVADILSDMIRQNKPILQA